MIIINYKMGLLDRMTVMWHKIHPVNRKFIRETSYWVFVYMLIIPATMMYTLYGIYDIHTRTYIRATVPDEVSEENF